MKEYTDNILALYENAKKYLPLFNRDTYEKAFLDFYEEEKAFLDSVNQDYETLESEEEQEAMMNAVASVLPNMISEKIDNAKKKSEKMNLTTDHNLLMTTYVIPALVWSRHSFWDKTADLMIEKWNAGPVMNKIQKSDYITLKEGFKSGPCYITTAVCENLGKADDCYELTILRKYRDEYLFSTQKGQEEVKQYYDIAPTIVKRINREEHKKEIYQKIYDRFLTVCIGMIENGKMEECEETYSSMVNMLQEKYLFS